jgi:hypothetical protein
MSQQGRHFYQSLLAAEILTIMFKLFRFADIAQNKHRSGASLTLLQPGVADSDPERLGIIRTRWS